MKFLIKVLAIISIVLATLVIINGSSNEVDLTQYMSLAGGLFYTLYGIDYYRKGNKTAGILFGLAGVFLLIVAVIIYI